MPKSLRLGILAWLCLLSACATLGPERSQPIGPYPEFSGRLLVIEPHRRWQVSIHWLAHEPESGWIRLVHALSHTVVELQWRGRQIFLRDSRTPIWRLVSKAQLEAEGIFLPPWTLAGILLGRMPGEFRATGFNVYHAEIAGASIRLRWQPDKLRLELADLTHDRKAILMINDATDAGAVPR